MNSKCHFTKLMPPCNPKVYRAVAASLTPQQPASYSYNVFFERPSCSELLQTYCGHGGPEGPGPGPGIPMEGEGFGEHFMMKSCVVLGARKLRSHQCVTLCVPCGALVQGGYVHEVALKISIFFVRPCALTIICGAIAVPRRSMKLTRGTVSYIYIYIYICIIYYKHILCDIHTHTRIVVPSTCMHTYRFHKCGDFSTSHAAGP